VLSSEWIDRLFSRFGAMYGAQWAEKWRGFDIAEVKATWAEDLDGVTGDQLRRALDHAKSHCSFPPSLPEFVGLCRQFRGVPSHQLYLAAPVSRMPPEIADQLKAFVSHVRGGDDCRKWARRIVANPKNYPGLSRQYALEALGIDEQDAIKGADNYELIAAVSARCPIEQAA
jgi:hypothetical protein